MWLVYAILTALFYIGLDFCVKRASGKIDDFLGMVIINVVAVLPALIGLIIIKFTKNELQISSEGIIWSLLAGLSIGVGSVTLIKMFSSGANLSIGSSIVRVGAVVGVVLVGTLFLKEVLTVKQVAGVALAILGLLLLIIK